MRRAVAGASLGLLFCGWAVCQSAAPPPTFDVADVQVSKAGPADPLRAQILPGGRVDIRNAPMKLLITEAYSVGPDDLTGGPGWLSAERYDIVAKADPKTPEATLRVMLQTLLAERFKLVIYKEEKVKSVYALVVAKGGPKFEQSKTEGAFSCSPGQGEPGMAHFVCHNLTMTMLAEALPRMASRWVDAPVVNLTELQGSYDLQLDWNARPQGSDPAAATDPGLVSMFDAIQKLGLKLESRKLALPIIVVDSVERTPKEN